MVSSKSEFWVRLYLAKTIRNAHKAAASRGGASALSAQSCVESTLGMTQNSDSSVDQIMNSQQTQSNQALAGVPSTRSTLTAAVETSSPKGGSSSSSSTTASLTNQNIYDTQRNAGSDDAGHGDAATGDGAADGGYGSGYHEWVTLHQP